MNADSRCNVLFFSLYRIAVIVTEVKGSGRGNNLRVAQPRELQAVCFNFTREIDSTCRHVFTARYDHVRASSSRRTLHMPLSFIHTALIACIKF